ncbi:MAG: dipeptidase [Pseudomonadota bacterium]|nr:dipeptidase [Pseudomonadota bacterium]
MKSLKLILLFSILSCSQPKEDIYDANFAQDILVIDTHIDVPYRLWRQDLAGNQIEDISSSTLGDFDYERAVKGGLDIPFFSIYLPAETEELGTSFDMANKLIDMMEDIVSQSPDKFYLVKSVKEAKAFPKKGFIGIALGMENGSPLQGDLSRVDYFYKRGIRYITLTHSKSNHISDSSYDDKIQWGGLSNFGKSVIKEMNKVGIIIDISHVNDDAFFQAIEISDVPVIASHSSLRHFTPGFERNVSVEMIIELAEKGGVVQINFGSDFLNQDSREHSSKLRSNVINFSKSQEISQVDKLSEQERLELKESYLKSNPYPYASIDDVIDHIDRVVQLVGINHVGLGSDFDGVGDTLPVNLKDVSMYPNLIKKLFQRGYSKSDINKILNDNFLRVWQEVEAYAEGK